MKCYLLFASTGTKLILTSYDSIEHPRLIKQFEAKGITKFIACEVSMEAARAYYGDYFDILCNDMYEKNDLRILDYCGQNSSRKFSFNELSNFTFHKPKQVDALDIYMVGV